MMEEQITNESINNTKRKYGKYKKEIEFSEKSTAAQSKNKELNEVKVNIKEVQSSKQDIIANKEPDSNKQESEKTNKNRVLKRKLTEDGVTIERVLSEGEASSGFETVSSIDSKLDFEDFELSSSGNEHDYNVIVHIENDLAYQHHTNSDGRRCYWKGKSNSKFRNNSQSERFLGKYPNPRHGIFRSYKQSKHWQRDMKDAHQRYDGTDRWSREEDDSRYFRRKASCDREWSRCSDHSIKSRGSRCSDQSKRSRGSVCNDGTNRRLRKCTTAYRSISGERSERDYRYIGSKSSSYKEIKRESKHSRNYDRSKSSMDRNLPSTRETSFSKSSSTSVWNRLDNDETRERFKKDSTDKSCRSSNAGHSRKKERTPFLVELERKLKEAESQKSVKKTEVAEKDENKTPVNVNEPPLVPEAVECLTPNLEPASSYTSPPCNPGIYSMQYPTVPALSVDNLPLVPGPTGLPVHITETGEQIPHDMDGRRIPVSPSGYYLPLDPTGRLFPHIVSPGNQAVPIHMTEDGILRLPNLEPVPYGPSHNLPVNIDGSVILIGPDSRPLGPCPNLPRHPPLHLLRMTQPSTVGEWQTEMQQETLTIPQTYQVEDEKTPQIRSAEEQHFNPSVPQLQPVESCLVNFIQNSCGKASKADFLMNYQKRVLEKKKDVLKCKEIEKNLGVSPSKGGVKRSIPKKLIQKKSARDEYCGDYDMIFDSSDSDSNSATVSKPSLDTKKGNEIKKYLESSTEDFVVVKIHQALKSLSEKNFKPPALGRFIISEVLIDLLKETSPNASPLWRKRVKLPFLTPNSINYHSKDEESAVREKTPVIFSFLPQEKTTDKRESVGKSGKTSNKNLNSAKFPVFTFDFAVQCDFTSMVIKNLSLKVSEMEMEVVRLRNINANLLDGFRNIHEANEKKSEELGKALLEIEKRNNEILSLKRLIGERGK